MYNHIVVIDDSQFDSEISQQILLISSFARRVTVFNSAMSALVYLNNEDELPECILLDLYMPIMDGFSFLSHYAELPDNKRRACRIVVLTGSAFTSEASSLRNNPDVAAVLEKPLTTANLNDLEVLFGQTNIEAKLGAN